MYVALLETPYTRIITDSNGEVGTYEYREYLDHLIVHNNLSTSPLRCNTGTTKFKTESSPFCQDQSHPDLPVRPNGIPTQIIMEEWNPERRLESSGRILMFDEDLEY